MRMFFTSDTHFFHDKIVEKCEPRQHLKTIEAHNEELVRRWNATVSPDDIVWHLGDFSFGTVEETRSVIECLHGTKFIVLGNHDRNIRAMVRMGFDAAFPSEIVVRLGGNPFLLSHYPYQEGQIARHVEKYGELYTKKTDLPLLCGHVHQAWKKQGKMLNVGVDIWDLAPVSAERILQEFK
jgi:calcineurin-like phosphoesterase family protein